MSDQKLQQAISNAYLLFLMWAEVLLAQCKVMLTARTDGGGVEGVIAGVGDPTAEELDDFIAGLKKIYQHRSHKMGHPTSIDSHGEMQCWT